jgi:hypothetical protein
MLGAVVEGVNEVLPPLVDQDPVLDLEVGDDIFAESDSDSDSDCEFDSLFFNKKQYRKNNATTSSLASSLSGPLPPHSSSTRMVASDFMSEEAIDDLISSQSSPPHSRSRPPPVLGAIEEGEEEEFDNQNQNALPFLSQRPQIALGTLNPSSLTDPMINQQPFTYVSCEFFRRHQAQPLVSFILKV